MTIDELKQRINEAKWFANLGRFQGEEGKIAIRTLAAWRSEATVADEYHEHVAESMRWLPSQSSDEDPIHGSSLKELAKKNGTGAELTKHSLEAYKLTLASLRSVPPHPLLKTGPHDFNPPARNAAAYASRMAAAEIVTERQGFWCSMFKLFNEGYFPCGIMPDGQVVVF